MPLPTCSQCEYFNSAQNLCDAEDWEVNAGDEACPLFVNPELETDSGVKDLTQLIRGE